MEKRPARACRTGLLPGVVGDDYLVNFVEQLVRQACLSDGHLLSLGALSLILPQAVLQPARFFAVTSFGAGQSEAVEVGVVLLEPVLLEPEPMPVDELDVSVGVVLGVVLGVVVDGAVVEGAVVGLVVLLVSVGDGVAVVVDVEDGSLGGGFDPPQATRRRNEAVRI
jgi:hypothetical protein